MGKGQYDNQSYFDWQEFDRIYTEKQLKDAVEEAKLSGEISKIEEEQK